jgi:metallophosphoesterase superfamily enzyme
MADRAAVLAGHWHPALTLRGRARDHERLACLCHMAHDGSTCWPVGEDRVWPGMRID